MLKAKWCSDNGDAENKTEDGVYYRYLPPSQNNPKNVESHCQAAYVSDNEVDIIIEDILAKNPVERRR